MSEQKCVIVIDPELPLGVIANAAAVLAVSLGKAVPELVGHDLQDADGLPHRGITTAAIPILKGSADGLQQMRSALSAHEPELTVVDLTDATRSTRSYAEYAAHLAATPSSEVRYLGLAVHGSSKLVNKFTGSLGLLR
ncbi:MULTISPECIES: DUF2000 domain-containing protein [Leeia]|uniref:DUF2000 domain-containing protein n=1 Tax=Leeia aquatica TaxID=2725557 RepID=A0A847S3G7_9NEIS|nr:DUF2000 domain-containing protein [Leeia aquatica]NLR74343.1 DUF2000 domain-containing protein [Leeia aquatica]